MIGLCEQCGQWFHLMYHSERFCSTTCIRNYYKIDSETICIILWGFKDWKVIKESKCLKRKKRRFKNGKLDEF